MPTRAASRPAQLHEGVEDFAERARAIDRANRVGHQTLAGRQIGGVQARTLRRHSRRRVTSAPVPAPRRVPRRWLSRWRPRGPLAPTRGRPQRRAARSRCGRGRLSASRSKARLSCSSNVMRLDAPADRRRAITAGMDCSHYAGRGDRQVKRAKPHNSKRESNLTPSGERRTMEVRYTRERFARAVSCHGGDTASTGVKTRGMHAELH